MWARVEVLTKDIGGKSKREELRCKQGTNTDKGVRKRRRAEERRVAWEREGRVFSP